MQRDILTRELVAREEGEAKGEVKGLIRMIHFCEGLLHRPQTPAEQLQALPLEELQRLVEQLQREAMVAKGTSTS